MKKLLLGLGGVSIAALPILGFTSCSLTQQTIDLGISKNSYLTTISKEMIDKTIDEFELAKIEFDAAEDENGRKLAKDKQIETLNIIFNGITIVNFDHFQTILNKENSSIELKGLENYVFGVSPTLLATPSPDPTVSIAVTGIKNNITIDEYKAFKLQFDSSINNQKMCEALSLLLTGVTEENFKHFKIKTTEEVIGGTGENKNEIKSAKVIFTAMPEYYFTNVEQTSIIISALKPEAF